MMSPRAQYLLQGLEERFENLPSREDEERLLSAGALKLVQEKRAHMRAFRHRCQDHLVAADAKTHLTKLHNTRLDSIQHDQGAWDREMRDYDALMEALGLR